MCAQIQQHIRKVGLNKDLEEAVSKIFEDRWNKMHSPLHAAAYMLEPQFRDAAFGREVSPIQYMHICGALYNFAALRPFVSLQFYDTLNTCRSNQTSERL